jgi:hypothetical protein
MRIVPLFGGSTAFKSFVVSRQRRLNCYYEKRQDQDKSKVVIYGTPGLVLSFNVTGNKVFRGFVGTPSAIYAITSNQFYVLSSTGAIVAATSTTTPLLTATMTAGTSGGFFPSYGFSAGVYGTLSPSSDINGNLISGIVSLTRVGISGTSLDIPSATSLGQAYVFSMTISGGDLPATVNLLGTAATYVYSAGINVWNWTGAVPFTVGISYAISITGFAANNAIPAIAYSPTQVVYVDGLTSVGYPIPSYIPQSTGIGAVSPNATTVAQVAGFFVVEVPNTRQFYVSAFNNGFSWPSLSFAYCASGSDSLVAVDELLGNLVLFRQLGCEFWQNQGLSPQPFAPILAAANTYGLAAKWSRAHIEQSIIYLAQNPEGKVQFVEIINSYNPQVISDADIDDIINSFSVVSDAEALVYQDGQHKFYQCTFPTANRSFLFDCSTRQFSEVQTGTSLAPTRHQARFSAYCGGNTYLSDYQTGNVYTMSSGAYTDNGVTIIRELITRHVSMAFNRFKPSLLYLDMETGVGLQTGQGQNPQIMLQYSKDNGRTWSGERWAALGPVGQYRTLVRWRRFGVTRDATFRIRMSDPVKFVITEGAMKLNERQPADMQS